MILADPNKADRALEWVKETVGIHGLVGVGIISAIDMAIVDFDLTPIEAIILKVNCKHLF